MLFVISEKLTIISLFHSVLKYLLTYYRKSRNISLCSDSILYTTYSIRRPGLNTAKIFDELTLEQTVREAACSQIYAGIFHSLSLGLVYGCENHQILRRAFELKTVVWQDERMQEIKTVSALSTTVKVIGFMTCLWNDLT